MQVLCSSLAVAGAGFPSASRKLPPPLVRCSCALPSRTRLLSAALFVVVIVCFLWARCGCVCGGVDRPYSQPGQVAASHIATRQHTVMLPPSLRLMMCQAVPTSVCLLHNLDCFGMHGSIMHSILTWRRRPPGALCVPPHGRHSDDGGFQAMEWGVWKWHSERDKGRHCSESSLHLLLRGVHHRRPPLCCCCSRACRSSSMRRAMRRLVLSDSSASTSTPSSCGLTILAGGAAPVAAPSMCPVAEG
jgi:hypothetical protein